MNVHHLLLELQALDFVLIELTLYLDTHSDDQTAIEQFNRIAKERAQHAVAYESEFGPLLQYGLSYSRYPWDWSHAPWPWQVD